MAVMPTLLQFARDEGIPNALAKAEKIQDSLEDLVEMTRGRDEPVLTQGVQIRTTLNQVRRIMTRLVSEPKTFNVTNPNLDTCDLIQWHPILGITGFVGSTGFGPLDVKFPSGYGKDPFDYCSPVETQCEHASALAEGPATWSPILCERMKIVEPQCSILQRTDGEYMTMIYTVLAVNQKAAIYHLDAAYNVPVEGTRCVHDYDCCGNWYAQPLDLMIDIEGYCIFRQDWARNV